MEKYVGKTLRRSLIVGIIMLFLSSMCLPVLATEELPDLAIEEIYVYVSPGGGRGPPWEREYIRCNFSNIGDEIVNEEDIIQFHIVVEKLLFNKIPIREIMNVVTHGYAIHNGLEPGRTVHETLTSHYILALPGYMKFKCTINPNNLIEESKYDNNYCERTFFGYIGWRTYRWIPVD